MYSRVVLVFFFYLTVLNGLTIDSDSSVNKTSNSDDLIAPKLDEVSVTNSSLNASSAAASVVKVDTPKPELEISNRNLGQQNVTNSSEIASRIGLDLDQHHPDPSFGVPHPDNGFVPSFLKTFRRKRNLGVNEDESNY